MAHKRKPASNQNDTKQRLKNLGLAFILLTVMVVLMAMNNGLSKRDVDDMSQAELSTYIYDTSTDDNNESKGEKLFNDNKPVYKYLFTQYFKKDYDDVTIPTNKEISKMTKKDDTLNDAELKKLEMENEKGYQNYIDNTRTQTTITNDVKDEELKSDKNRLKEDIDNQLDITTSSIDDYDYTNNDLGVHVTVTLKGIAQSSDDETKESSQLAIAQVVNAVKHSDILVDDLTVAIEYPLTKDEYVTEHALKSHWLINGNSDLENIDAKTLSEHLEQYAENYTESPNLRALIN